MEYKFERKLKIDTLGDVDWENPDAFYNRYEPTTYKYLEILFKQYTLPEQAVFIDFGCGKGRVLFYVHEKFKIPVKGIEANAEIFKTLEENEASYSINWKIEADKRNFYMPEPMPNIALHLAYAEDYVIEEEDNVFYFFNPFDITIFRKVHRNILNAWRKKPRAIDIILYYPTRSYTQFMLEESPFIMQTKIYLPNLFDLNEKFFVYRLDADALI